MKKLSEIKIIRASAAHAPNIAEIEKSCFSQPWSEKSISSKIADSNGIFLAALDDEILCGYVSGNVSSPVLYINNVALRQDYRGRGIGRMLLTRLEDESRTRGVSELTLEVRTSNFPAIKLYEALGYKILGKRSGFYSHPAEDAYIMQKDLGAESHQQ